jgi:hypothetical protein
VIITSAEERLRLPAGSVAKAISALTPSISGKVNLIRQNPPLSTGPLPKTVSPFNNLTKL